MCVMFDCFSEQSRPYTCRNVRTVVAVSVSTILVVSIIVCTVGLHVEPGKTSKGKYNSLRHTCNNTRK